VENQFNIGGFRMTLKTLKCEICGKEIKKDSNLKNKQKIKLMMSRLEEKNKTNQKTHGIRYNTKWKKQPYGEWALLKAKLEGYKMAEEDLE